MRLDLPDDFPQFGDRSAQVRMLSQQFNVAVECS